MKWRRSAHRGGQCLEYVRPTGMAATGANAGVQAGVFSYPERSLAVSVTANAWGTGSESGEMVIDLPKRLADLCAPYAGVR